MNDYRCFVWDFDGTLYDTYGHIVSMVKAAMDEMDLSHEGVDVMKLAKTTLHQACIALAGPERAEELLRGYFAHANAAGLENLKPFPQCKETLQAVVDRGGVNYLYTHRNNGAIQALERDGLVDLFKDFITDEADFASKPSPDALNWLIDQHRLDRSECVMVGDRPIDAGAGKNAGITTALFDPDGYFTPEDADFVFTSLMDIPDTLMEQEFTENNTET
ncbi:MAG: HAD-IA family hydrolase [Clostridiales bacterium]|jgi:phosphoglycolate phosphatase-like HAD superfamily hydrolase|nr:HAD-IA family hydrolase [Clostridiales bacterium]